MPKVEPPRVAVIGAGPIGIEAALYAKACGLSVAVFDRGGIAEHMRRWGHVRLFTPFGLNVTPLGLEGAARARSPTEPFRPTWTSSPGASSATYIWFRWRSRSNCSKA